MYEIRTAPGCYRGPDAPLVSEHRSLAAAVRAARKNDRVRVEPGTSSVCLYQAKSKQPTKYGYGLYGGADTRPFAECLAEAEANERAWRDR